MGVHYALFWGSCLRRGTSRARTWSGALELFEGLFLACTGLKLGLFSACAWYKICTKSASVGNASVLSSFRFLSFPVDGNNNRAFRHDARRGGHGSLFRWRLRRRTLSWAPKRLESCAKLLMPAIFAIVLPKSEANEMLHFGSFLICEGFFD
jgi:hypothetical protein